MSAVEGLKVATPLFEPYVVPIALVLLIGLFLVQSRGTAVVGGLFGPVMLVWFTVLAALGIWGILHQPHVLLALNPIYGLSVLVEDPVRGFLMLGSVFLAVTGTEALYADMGHFGRPALRRAWLGLVFPALMLNYLGQGALLLGNPAAIENPFYLLAPEWGLYPLVGLASVATIIASQAVISGAFSYTRQAIQLGYLPRLEVRHTSETEIGQVYVPRINYILLIAIIIVVLVFQSSDNLGAAYGIAVSGDMTITTILAFLYMRSQGWSLAARGPAIRRLRDARPDLPDRQHAEIRARRLVPDPRRDHRLLDHGDMVARPPDHGRAARPRRAAARRSSSRRSTRNGRCGCRAPRSS